MNASAAPDLTPFGLAVGHATDDAGATGLTVIRGIDQPLRAGVAIFGRATGSRELHAASADHRVGGRIDAIMLTGGSAYGLDAAAGVMRWMEEHGRGFAVRGGVISSFFVWVGFVLTTTATNQAFHGTKPIVTVIDAAH